MYVIRNAYLCGCLYIYVTASWRPISKLTIVFYWIAFEAKSLTMYNVHKTHQMILKLILLVDLNIVWCCHSDVVHFCSYISLCNQLKTNGRFCQIQDHEIIYALTWKLISEAIAIDFVDNLVWEKTFREFWGLLWHWFFFTFCLLKIPINV